MKTGVVGLSFSATTTFVEFLEIARGMGIEGFEIPSHRRSFKGTLDLLTDDLGDVRARIGSSGLEVLAIGGYNDFVQARSEQLEAEIERVKRLCDIAVAFGCRVVRVFGGEPKDDVPRDQWTDMIVDGFRTCVGYAETSGVYLGLENHGLLTNDADLEIEIIERVGSDNLGITVDTSNFRWYGHSLETVHGYLKRLAPYAVHAHIKDGSAQSGIREDYTATALGEGEIDVGMFIDQLKGCGYGGALCIEYEGKEDPREGAEKSLRFLRRLLATSD